jgi:hypothetical protein
MRESCTYGSVRGATSNGGPYRNRNGFRIISLLMIPLLLVAASAASTELTYKEYAKAPDAWTRGYVFGIAHYMGAVAQPDEEPPYPLRETFQRCLGGRTDDILVRKVESYVAAHRATSQGPMETIVIRSFFDLCRSEIKKLPPSGRKTPR